jgi:cytochrome P450
MTQEEAMGVLYDTLLELAPERDPEMLQGYQRYETVLAELLTRDQMETYAAHIRATGEVRIFDEMTPGELTDLSAEMAAIATEVLASIDGTMENRRVVALLNQRGEHDVAPDLGQTRR